MGSPNAMRAVASRITLRDAREAFSGTTVDFCPKSSYIVVSDQERITRIPATSARETRTALAEAQRRFDPKAQSLQSAPPDSCRSFAPACGAISDVRLHR